MARLLITRPEEDAKPLAARLAAAGHEPLIAPLLSILFLDEELSLNDVQALLFTSANGVRAAAVASAERKIPALCVGDATARAAEQAGFVQIESANGDVNTLAELTARRCKPDDGPLLHVAGTKLAGDLAGMLEARGFTVRRTVLYRSDTAQSLPETAAKALSDGTVDGVLLFSPRTAATFADLVKEAGLSQRCRDVDMLCLSRAVADALGDLPHARTRIAREPTQDALIDLL